MTSSNRTLIALHGLLSEISAAPQAEQEECDLVITDYSEISKLRLQPQGVQSERCVEAARARDTKVLERYARHSQYGNVKDWSRDILDEIARSRGMKAWAV